MTSTSTREEQEKSIHSSLELIGASPEDLAAARKTVQSQILAAFEDQRVIDSQAVLSEDQTTDALNQAIKEVNAQIETLKLRIVVWQQSLALISTLFEFTDSPPINSIQGLSDIVRQRSLARDAIKRTASTFINHAPKGLPIEKLEPHISATGHSTLEELLEELGRNFSRKRNLAITTYKDRAFVHDEGEKIQITNRHYKELNAIVEGQHSLEAEKGITLSPDEIELIANFLRDLKNDGEDDFMPLEEILDCLISNKKIDLDPENIPQQLKAEQEMELRICLSETVHSLDIEESDGIRTYRCIMPS